MKSKIINQKSKIFRILAVALLATIVSANCYAQKIAITTEKYRIVNFSVNGTGTVTVDWGDGSKIERYELKKRYDKNGRLISKEFEHRYPHDNLRTAVITGNITDIDISTVMTNLDVSKNTALTDLNVFDCLLPALDVSKNVALTGLFCRCNEITYLDVSKNTALEYFICSENELNVLDIGNNTKLLFLMCERCLLTTLDVSKNTALTELYCGRNKLTALDVSKNTALTKLVLHNNEFSADALNDLFDILPSNKGNKTVYIGRNPGTDACNRKIAEDKGWIVETTGDYE